MSRSRASGGKRCKPANLGADKGYNKAFLAWLCRRGDSPHIARMQGRSAPGLDDRTGRHNYASSQRKPRRLEEIFGWMKNYGKLRGTRFRDIARV
jgi:hypothetical protein